MNPSDHNHDEAFALRLAEYDAAVARGRKPADETGDDPELAHAKACLDRLEARWPREPRRSRSLDATLQALDTLVEETSTQFGRFTIVRELGRGGGGIVFLANDPKLKRQVALKVPRADALFTPSLRRRFLREAEAAAQLDHRHIVPIYEAGETGGICYLVSAYCPGPNLASWLRNRAEPVPARQAALIALALAEGVAQVHRRGILHRDIKPSNVLLASEADGELPFVPKLTDFGLAKLEASQAEAQGEPAEARTRTGAILGTPAYMAPEQAEGRLDRVGPATDVYALGVVLYELVAGKPPFRGDSDVATLQQVVSDEPRPLRRMRRGVPRDLETICNKCLEKRPERRYADAAALGDDLRRFLEGRPITARPVGRLERTVKWLRRRPLAPGMAALIVAGCSAILALALREPAAAIVAPPGTERSKEFDALQWSARSVLYSNMMRKAGRLYEDEEFVQLGELLRGSMPEKDERDARGFEWHYLWRLAQRDLLVLKGHTAPLNHAAFSADGRLCATASEHDKKIILWEWPQGRRIAEYPLDVPRNFLLMLSTDGSRLVAAFQSGGNRSTERVVLKVWDVAAGTVMAEHCFPWRAAIAVAPDGRRVAGIFDPYLPATRAELQIADIGQGVCRTLLKTDNVDLHNPTFSPDGKLIAVGYRSDGRAQVHLVEATGGAFLAKCQCSQRSDYAIAPSFSADGKQLAIATFLGHGSIWNWSTETVVRFREEGNVTKVTFDPSGSVLAVRVETASGPPKIRLRHAGTGESLREITPTAFNVDGFALSPDGQTIALCGNDNVLHVQQLKPAPAEKWLPPPAPRGEAWAVAFSPEGRTLAVGYDNEDGQDAESLKLWDVKEKRTNARVFAGHQGMVAALAYSPDGATLATASFDNKVGLWNATDGKYPLWLEGHTKPVRAVAFSPDGRLLASAGSDRNIMLWDVAQRKLLAGWTGSERDIRALAFAPDGRQLASAGNDRCTAIWDVQTHKRLFTLTDDNNVPCLAYAPDGKLLATGNERFAIKLWDAATGELKQTLKGHTGKVRALTFSPDGLTLATGGEDNMVRLWNVAAREELFAFPTEHFINGLAFDRAGKTLAAALHDGTVKIWSAYSRVAAVRDSLSSATFLQP